MKRKIKLFDVQPVWNAHERPPAIDCHIVGITSKRRDPNFVDSCSKACLAPLLERRALLDSSVFVLSIVLPSSFSLREDDKMIF